MGDQVSLQCVCRCQTSKALRNFLYEVAKRFRFCIEELEVAPNHVHVIATLRPSVGPAQVLGLMKGYTSRMLFILEEQKLKKFYWREKGKRQLWGDGKFIASVGHITLEKAKDDRYARELHRREAFYF
ncbi:IS200/IS605 family transposase [Candidatus Woesearchaeota archaeon]|nr:IS200/IS605 family transposase [Candidatus Woesearchaeota archaeon]